jgi:2-polyprenyl-6-hydroxyphenyl methylase/3-demethylubiquinone-9 3-methyltransferase
VPAVSRVTDRPERFAFGKNWLRFLKYLTEERIAESQKSLCAMLETVDLRGKTFLDIGCGSGLFSLAALRLGAKRVFSFDFDPQSVACTEELKRRYFDRDQRWNIHRGSVLDSEFLSALGQFDIAYSWGVLHHTGNMWHALENVTPLVAAHGKLFIALYNDQGVLSTAWKTIKRQYNRGLAWRMVIIPTCAACLAIACLIKDVVFLRKNPLSRYREYKQARGMAYTTDLLDWLGGFPFEVAKPDAVFDFFRVRGFELAKLKTVGMGLGNNEFVFVKRRVQ